MICSLDEAQRNPGDGWAKLPGFRCASSRLLAVIRRVVIAHCAAVGKYDKKRQVSSGLCVSAMSDRYDLSKQAYWRIGPFRVLS